MTEREQDLREQCTRPTKVLDTSVIARAYEMALGGGILFLPEEVTLVDTVLNERALQAYDMAAKGGGR